MPRRIRLDGPALAHHVMVRGLDGAALFFDTSDRQDFVDRMASVLPSCGAKCFAWALMSNHVHLVVQTEAGTLTRVMRRLNTGHAVRLNRRRGRRGYVFMDRFRSRIVESDADLVGLIRYVHRNPLEARLVSSLDALARHPWCGHAALIGARRPHPFEAASEALSLLDEDVERARAALRRWMATADEDDTQQTASAPRDPIRRPSPPATGPAPTEVLEGLLRGACERYQLERRELASGSKQARIARARAALAYLAVVERGLAGRQVAAALGVSPGAISAALERGRRICEEDDFGFAPGGESRI